MEHIYNQLPELINPSDSTGSGYQVKGAIAWQGHTDTTAHSGVQIFTRSLFEGHQLKASAPAAPTLRHEATSGWIFGLLFLSLALVALIRGLYSKRLRIILLAPFSSRKMGQVIRDADLLSPALKGWLQVNYLAMLSLAAYLITQRYISLPVLHPALHGITLYLSIFILLSALYIIRHRVARFWGHLFKETEISFRYRLNHLLISIMIGLALIPVLTGILYLPAYLIGPATVTGGIIIGILLLVRTLKSIYIGITFRWYALIYIFLYLCTLEILPVLLLLKAISVHDPA